MVSRFAIRCVWLACLLALRLHAATPEDLTVLSPEDLTVPSNAPTYTAAGVVPAATQAAGPLAPNAIATIYGTNLAYDTHAVAAGDLVNGGLPTSVDGVSVIMYGVYCGLFYVSPTQINFLVPYSLALTSSPLTVTRQGTSGQTVTIPMALTAPAFFEWNGLAIAEHADGSLITATAPAQAGEVIVLYAAGLGRTAPDQVADRVAAVAAPILYGSQLLILLNGAALPANSVLYAGVTPGFAGLYQINLQLPNPLAGNPQIQVTIGAQMSPPAILLPTQGPVQ